MWYEGCILQDMCQREEIELGAREIKFRQHWNLYIWHMNCIIQVECQDDINLKHSYNLGMSIDT